MRRRQTTNLPRRETGVTAADMMLLDLGIHAVTRTMRCRRRKTSTSTSSWATRRDRCDEQSAPPQVFHKIHGRQRTAKHSKSNLSSVVRDETSDGKNRRLRDETRGEDVVRFFFFGTTFYVAWLLISKETLHGTLLSVRFSPSFSCCVYVEILLVSATNTGSNNRRGNWFLS